MSSLTQHKYEEVPALASDDDVQEVLTKFPSLKTVASNPRAMISQFRLAAQGHIAEAQAGLTGSLADLKKGYMTLFNRQGYLASPLGDFGSQDFKEILAAMDVSRDAQMHLEKAAALQDAADSMETAESGVDVYAGDQFGSNEPAYMHTIATPEARLALYKVMLKHFDKSGPQPGSVVWTKGAKLPQFETGMTTEVFKRQMAMPYKQLSQVVAQDPGNQGDNEKVLPVAYLIQGVMADGINAHCRILANHPAEPAIGNKVPTNLPTTRINPLAHPASHAGVNGALRKAMRAPLDITSAEGMRTLVGSVSPHFDAAYTPSGVLEVPSGDMDIDAQISRFRTGAAAASKPKQTSSESIKPSGHSMIATGVMGISAPDSPGVVNMGNYMSTLSDSLGANAAGVMHGHLVNALRNSHAMLGMPIDSAKRTEEGGFSLSNGVVIRPFSIAHGTSDSLSRGAFSLGPAADGKLSSKAFDAFTEAGFMTINKGSSPISLHHPSAGKFELKPNESMITKAFALSGKDHNTVLTATPAGPVNKADKTYVWRSDVSVPGTHMTGSMVSGEAFFEGTNQNMAKTVNLVYMN